MSKPGDESDVQEDFCFLLDEYPFLKKFGKQDANDVFTEEKFRIFEQLRGMCFRINFEDKKAVSATPCFLTEFTGKPSKREVENQTEKRTTYSSNDALINSYIKCQLINSGILDVLSDVPNRKMITQQYEKNETQPIPPYWKDSPEFETSIMIRLNPNKKSITSTNFHNDSTLFQILQYSRPPKPYVLGSELMFYHENNDTIIHRGIEKKETGEPFFPIEKMGNLIHEKYELSKSIYNGLKTDANYKQSIIRSKLNNGDTVVFPDTLWKHAVINPKEKREGDLIHIEIANTNRADNDLTVSICPQRILTDQSQYEGRQIIGIFCFICMNYIDPQYFGSPISLLENEEMKISVKTVNLDAEQCSIFLNSINDPTGCVRITGTGEIVNVKSRGGKKIKSRKSRKPRKKNNKKIANPKRTFKNYL